MNSPSDRGRRLASISPSPTVSAGVTSRSSSGSSSSKRPMSLPAQHRQRRAQGAGRGRIRIVGEHLVGGLLGLFERETEPDQSLDDRPPDAVPAGGGNTR